MTGNPAKRPPFIADENIVAALEEMRDRSGDTDKLTLTRAIDAIKSARDIMNLIAKPGKGGTIVNVANPSDPPARLPAMSIVRGQVVYNREQR